MPPAPFEPFVRACQRADPETFAEFVVELHEARGWTLERQQGRRLVFAADGRTRTVAVATDGEAATDDADALVRRTEAPDGEDAVDPADLHRQLCYAVEPAVRDRLTDLLGVPTDADSAARGQREESGGADTNQSDATGTGGPSRVWQRAPVQFAVVVLLAALVVAAAGALTLGGDGGAIAGTGDARTTPSTAPESTLSPGTAGASGGETTVTGDASSSEQSGSADTLDSEALAVYAAESRAESWDGQAGSPDAIDSEKLALYAAESRDAHSGPVSRSDRPAWVAPNGTVDGQMLASMHRSVVAGTSATFTLRYAERTDGRVTGRYRERVRVASDGRYSVSVSTLGSLESTAPDIVGYDAYHDGNTTVVRETSRAASTVAVPARAGDLLARYASAVDATVVGQHGRNGTTTYRVRIEGAASPWLANASGVAFVTESGVVKYGRWSYERSDRAGERVVLTLETAGVGETVVSRPAWVSSDR